MAITPFGAILVDQDGNILLEQENIEITEKNCSGHAETSLMIAASKKYPKDFLWNCTLYTNSGTLRHVRRCHLLGQCWTRRLWGH